MGGHPERDRSSVTSDKEDDGLGAGAARGADAEACDLRAGHSPFPDCVADHQLVLVGIDARLRSAAEKPAQAKEQRHCDEHGGDGDPTGNTTDDEDPCPDEPKDDENSPERRKNWGSNRVSRFRRFGAIALEPGVAVHSVIIDAWLSRLIPVRDIRPKSA